MRLLNTETLELREFFDNEIPRYAILSHTWEKEEVLFRDMADIKRAERNYGFEKLKGACELARSQSFEYIWIDTCCIDKSSSAELTEAINSMYRWYQEAAVCYAYLSDVSHRKVPTAYQFDEEEEDMVDLNRVAPAIRASRWWTRGWTLQELVAPQKLEFYSSTWVKIGNKKDSRMSALVSDITGVDVHTLLGGDPSEVSIARRMFWASKRQTTRLEDRAYSLLGLFDVNMPLIYGEGRKAFRRLQEEILKTSDDQSIFAWHNPDYSEGAPVDVLAASPSDFAESGSLSRQAFFRVGREATTITSQGISCHLPLMSVARLDTTDFKPFTEVDAILDCQLGSVPGTFPTIRLRSLPSKKDELPKHFYRVMTAEMTKFEAYTLPTLLNDTNIIGLDPTQLHRDDYIAIMDKNYLQWKLASIVFTRRLPVSLRENAPYSGIPWSLSLLSDDYPPDCTSFWFVTFGTGTTGVDLATRITFATPQDRWDTSSMQLRVLPIPPHFYGIGQFQIVDGVFNIEVSIVHSKTVIFTTSLIVGRQAPSRRESPRPWCRIFRSAIGEKITNSLLDNHSDTRNLGIRNLRIHVGSGGVRTMLNVDRLGLVLEAAVATKEISGIYYHVVAINTSRFGEGETGLYLLNDDDVGKAYDTKAEGVGQSTPIRCL